MFGEEMFSNLVRILQEEALWCYSLQMEVSANINFGGANNFETSSYNSYNCNKKQTNKKIKKK